MGNIFTTAKKPPRRQRENKFVERGSRRILPQASDRVLIGKEGLAVSPICVGHVEDPDTISTAFDLGINFFFLTADMHWREYDSTRRGLSDLLQRRGGVRDKIVVAVASYVTQPEFTYLPF